MPPRRIKTRGDVTMKRHNIRHAWVVLVSMILLSATPLFADDPATGIIYLKDHTVAVTAPKGWVLDDESGRPQGLQAVFYPSGTEWVAAEAVMYVNTYSRNIESSLDALIADDLERMKEISPNVQVRRGEPIRLAGGATARVSHTSGDKWGNFESVAYIDTPADYVAIVLTSKTEAAYKSAQAAFVELVKSYRLDPPEAQGK
jgi:hypothetical protein